MNDDISLPSSGYDTILSRINNRTADAVIGKGRVRSVALRQALTAQLHGAPGQPGSFLADPVFEAARVWKRSNHCLDDLAGNLLEEELVAALDREGPRRWPRSGEGVAPYLHQLRAWEAASVNRSFMVTSGTGSGKTECFMIPILNDLLRQSGDRRRPGVQAILLYPLNALIDSQKERLSAWMDPLADRLSYALYKGDMPEALPQRQRRHGAEIRDRKTLRESPASVLVTNVTMLEYMLMRAQDRPILEQSQGALRWIVLDEAHSYVGAQAAEMALLLRRVRDAFGVKPEAVRLAATSATIGEGPETRAALKSFLADLAGLEPSQVEVIEGEEIEPTLPPEGPDSALVPEQLPGDNAALWDRLAPHPRIRRLRAAMRDGGVTLGQAGSILQLGGDRADVGRKTLRLLEAAAQAQAQNQSIQLAPWRLHVFHRAQGGLWACIDPSCSARAPELRAEGTDWPWGAVHLEERERCDCGAPVFELGACDECGTPWLLGERQSVGLDEFLRPDPAEDRDDEYILDAEPDEIAEEEAPAQSLSEKVLVGPAGENSKVFIRTSDAALLEHPGADERVVPLRLVETAQRDCCDKAGHARVTVRPQRYGAPFLMGNALPLLIEAARPNPAGYPVPFAGRRLLSFTDSRQGTARFSAKLQQEAERTLTRAIVYHRVRTRQGDPAKAAELRAAVEALRALVATTPALQTTLTQQEAALAEAEGGLKPVSWGKMVTAIAENPDHANFARPVWRNRPHKGDTALAGDPTALAELFLYREFFRRPRLQNNAETMGLARLRFPKLDEQARLSAPQALREAGHEVAVWADVLHAAVDIVFRANLAIRLPTTPVDVRHWISPRSALAAVLEPNVRNEDASSILNPKPFPHIRGKSGLITLLFRLTGGTRDSATDFERVGELLTALWDALRRSGILWQSGPGAWRLDMTKSAIEALEHAYECPVTRRLLPFAPAGVSLNALEAALACRVDLPVLPITAPTGPTQAERDQLRDWLVTDPAIAALRLQGHWTNLNDRVAEFSPFLRAQEHSAQIDRKSLETYETAFKRGEINVLNCSTTMEMGVDIPDVGLVVNTNVPPSPANYRQRIGRAGRRGEPWAMAFTFCKDVPLDNLIFHNPARLLQAEIRAPQVRLDSAVLVQRHVNAAILGLFLRGSGGLNVKTSIGAFFGATENPDDPFLPGNVAEDFLVALKGDWATLDKVMAALTNLVKGTCLAGQDGLAVRCQNAFETMAGRWRAEYAQLLAAQAIYPESEAAHRLYRHRARRMRDEFMMTELARRGFTPSYGFPVDVVTFDHAGIDGFNSGPARQLDIAIREYSPGSEVVIDGLVHRSEGILPTWGNRHDPSSVEDLRTLWTCIHCGAFGTTRQEVTVCPKCDNTIKRQELLRPSGFLGSRTPHSAYEQVAFVRPDPPRVSAEPELWVSLPDPEVGRHRTAREGRVLSTASGEHRQGYAICIACGRAEAETDADSAALPIGLRNHFPLQKLRDNPREDGRCPGNEAASRKVRRRVKLGAEVTTDVFELQIDALLATEKGAAQAWGIAAGLREALAQSLGVDAETMGVAVAPSHRADGTRRTSLFLFDKSSGGSGFSSAADRDLPSLLRNAADWLDCKSACSEGCPDCVLRRDLQFGTQNLDRPGALAILREAILPRLDLPEALRLFGPGTRAITEPLADRITRLSSTGGISSLVLFLIDPPAAWNIDDWLGQRLLSAIASQGAHLAVALRKSDISALEMSHKLDLVRLAARSGASIHAVDAMPEVGGKPILAELSSQEKSLAIASAGKGATHVDRNWGSVSEGPLLSGEYPATVLSGVLSLDKLAVWGEGNSAHRNITTELDGLIGQFGSAFWKIVKGLRPQAFTEGKQLSSVLYNDRYLRSPLTARLLLEAWQKMPLREAQTRLEVVSESTGQDARPGHLLHHSWEGDGIRQAVLTVLFPEASVRLTVKSGCAHARFFRLSFEDGATVTVFLDQGFGAWRDSSSRATRFDHGASAQEQARELGRVRFNVTLQDEGRIPSPIWVRW